MLTGFNYTSRMLNYKIPETTDGILLHFQNYELNNSEKDSELLLQSPNAYNPQMLNDSIPGDGGAFP